MSEREDGRIVKWFIADRRFEQFLLNLFALLTDERIEFLHTEPQTEHTIQSRWLHGKFIVNYRANQ